ncbi:MAG TPA: GNAT family N-acetyltransferase [Streptosporangiaceae bacterium]|jgi:RimJ/RimL family protein N-acetyltransferase|nr:GNAT family N-acetyltransferase [Streptosporangiaceae bacterium]
MRIERFDPAADDEQALACYRLYVDSQPADDPDGPTTSERVFIGTLRHGWGDGRREMTLARDTDGICGGYLLELPARANRHLAELAVRVAPGQRRHGYGVELLRHAARLARDDGRTVLTGVTRAGGAGDAFAAAMGATCGLTEVRRVLDLDTVPAGLLAGLRARAEAASAGYSLLGWSGATPEEHLVQVAQVSATIHDAPRSPSEQAERFDAERVRNDERRSAGRGIRRHTVVARCDATGELAGLTRISVDSGDPAWGLQRITVVARAHRGHRLGLLVKVALLDRLAETEPAVRRIITENADTNQHMIAINDELGFYVLDTMRFWELDPVAILS